MENGITKDEGRAIEKFIGDTSKLNIPVALVGTFERTWINATCQPKEGGRYWCVVEEQNDLGLSKFQWNCDYNPNDKRWSDNGNAMNVLYYTELAPMP